MTIHRCPDEACHSTDLEVQVLAWATLDESDPADPQTDADGTEHSWCDASRMRCSACGFTGTASRFEYDPYAPEPDPTEREEGDWVTEDYRTFTQFPTSPNAWRDRVTVGEGEDWRVVLKARMDQSQFWPNVWSLSDHGNLCLLSLTEE